MGEFKCSDCGWQFDTISELNAHTMIVHIPESMKAKTDSINPDHYKAGGIEVIDILRAKLTPEQFEGFLMGNVIKYTFRCKMKNGAEDLKKAAWYSSMLAGVDPRK